MQRLVSLELLSAVINPAAKALSWKLLPRCLFQRALERSLCVSGEDSAGRLPYVVSLSDVVIRTVATELVMRRAPVDAVHASILPSWSRTGEQRDLIAEFHFRPDNLDRDGFKDLYAAASNHLEKVDNERGFRYDKLRIEVSGPTQPHLTLIVCSGSSRDDNRSNY